MKYDIPTCLLLGSASLLAFGCGSTIGQGDDLDADVIAESDAALPKPDAAPPNFYGKVYAHSNSELYQLDPETLETTPIAPFGGECASISITDIAVDNEGNIFGVAGGRVFAIDKESAECTLIATGTGTYNALSFIAGSGTPFGGGEVLIGVTASGVLHRIDVVTGDTSEYGRYGDGVSSSGDLVSVEGFGTVATVNFGSEEFLANVDLDTGYAEQIAVTPGGTYGLGFWGGTVYGFCSDGSIYSIDPESGAIEMVDQTDISWWGAGVTTLAPVIL